MNLSLYQKLAASAPAVTQPISGKTFNFIGILSNVVTWFLWIAGAFALIYLIYGGIMYITAAGNEERTKAGKNAVAYAIIGLVVIALSFIITNWIGDILKTAGPIK